MKKILTILILVALVSGCSVINEKQEEKQVVYPEIVENVNKKFEYELGKCLISTAKVEFSELTRGDEITIIDEDDDFYYFDNNGLTLAIDKGRVRTEKEGPFEEYMGYTVSGAEMYSDIDMKNFVTDFYRNDNVLVKDKFLNRLLVEYDGQEGYMYPSDVKEDKIVVYSKPAAQPQPSSGGGGGGGSYTPPASSPNEGDDIGASSLLGFVSNGEERIYESNTSYESISGVVLAYNSPTYLTLCDRNQDIKVLDYDENEVNILVHGFVGRIKRQYAKLEGDTDYEDWYGYSVSGGEVFRDFDLTDRIEYLAKNDDVHVIDKIDDVYIVELSDGSPAYMMEIDVSETRLATYHYVAPEPAPSGGGGGYTPPAPSAPAEPVWGGLHL